MTEEVGRKKLSQVAYEKIRAAILSNDYPQGTMLAEKQLCQLLGMSRTPIRQAIQMLADEGLLEVRDGVGTFVRGFSSKDIQDAYELRRVLEVLAIQTAAARFTDEELDELERLFRDMLDRLEHGGALSVDEYAAADWKLHDMIIRKCDNRYVKNAMGNIEATLKRYQGLSVRSMADAGVSLREHLDILEGIRRGDRERLTRLLEQHVHY